MLSLTLHSIPHISDTSLIYAPTKASLSPPDDEPAVTGLLLAPDNQVGIASARIG